MSQLFSRIEGTGQPLVVLHGWGMNHRVWEPVRQPLAEHAQVSWIDLPGHGDSHQAEATSIDGIAELLLPHIPQGAVIMGWSLGGLVAQALAVKYPERVAALILVASTPCFVQHDNWAYGLPQAVLQGFSENLQQDYQATVKRFFALQFMGVKSDPKAVSQLRNDIMSKPATMQALTGGLAILNTADFSQQVIEQPKQWIFGRLDKLIPASLADALEPNESQQVHVMQKAAHVPFVTHPDEFLAVVIPFIEQVQHGQA
ncbi:MAG: Biotin synthesis protein BioH [uncultured Thiotrichaceae bacterium]|uniref:Pimeloyl-[acyl-carrier protein] methyl ester esterase n=1 Tax=uncultured Thiotrichaceae bacterium TaxID=298394 RepID=A0A6S6RXD3_9GAMM|nr:MAG: Biotin synthesis protein BioH [uncultured Thiotrichaceae bacterium]